VLDHFDATDQDKWDECKARIQRKRRRAIIYKSFFQFSKMSNYHVDREFFCMHAALNEKDMKTAFDVTFCLVSKQKLTPETKVLMAKVLKRMLSQQGDQNLIETFKHHNNDNKESDEKNGRKANHQGIQYHANPCSEECW
jgi:hypothetical protein